MKTMAKVKKLPISTTLLSVITLFSISIILAPSSVYAEEISVKSIGLDETTIITVTNESMKDIKSFRIWLSENFNFESFKTEKNWIGEKNSQGVIVFTSSDSIKIGESVKFGIKTDKTNPAINWKGLDQNNLAIETGFVISEKLSNVNKNPEINPEQNQYNKGTGIFSESKFKIIPNNPNAGSTIRVTGEQFASLQKFDFYIDNTKVGDFSTDRDGKFITTMTIPQNAQERVDFKIKSHEGLEKKISLRLGEGQNRISEAEEIKISIEGIGQVVSRGDVLDVFGNSNPGKALTVKILNPNQDIINTRTTEADSQGKWALSESISIPFDAEFGKYSIIVSDGKNQVLKYWELRTDKTILIQPLEQMYEPGELIQFQGTALPGITLELILEDPLGDEVSSDVIEVDESGMVNFEYQTTENDDKEGTWALIATQKDNKEFIYVGYGVYPTIPINVKFDQENYQSTDTATISLIGKPSDTVKLLIIGPSGNIQEAEIEIKLQEDGRGKYELSLSGYNSGIYTAVIKKANSQSTEKFSVGLQLGSGKIEVNTTKPEYRIGEKILLLGETNSNVLLNVELIDPTEKVIRTLEIPSNNLGIFTEERLRIPTNGIVGTWKILVTSGVNQSTIEFDVISNLVEDMQISVEEGIKIPGFGQTFKIDILTSQKASVIIEVLDYNLQVIDTLNCNTTTEYKCEVLWTVTKDRLPGTYTIKATDSISSAEKSFIVN
tara:strand:- start:80 stop:2248 length:2169 start_codon:yes stop_codon:yes gene_type:complete